MRRSESVSFRDQSPLLLGSLVGRWLRLLHQLPILNLPLLRLVSLGRKRSLAQSRGALPGLQLKTAGGRQETVSKWGTENTGRLFSFPVSAVGHAGTALRRDPSGPANFEHFHERHTGPRRFVRK